MRSGGLAYKCWVHATGIRRVRRYWLFSRSGVQSSLWQGLHLGAELTSSQLWRPYSIQISEVFPLGSSVNPFATPSFCRLTCECGSLLRWPSNEVNGSRRPSRRRDFLYYVKWTNTARKMPCLHLIFKSKGPLGAGTEAFLPLSC
jgi:hypothetical protein